jgi:hypothetical protein
VGLTRQHHVRHPLLADQSPARRAGRGVTHGTTSEWAPIAGAVTVSMSVSFPRAERHEAQDLSMEESVRSLRSSSSGTSYDKGEGHLTSGANMQAIVSILQATWDGHGTGTRPGIGYVRSRR